MASMCILSSKFLRQQTLGVAGPELVQQASSASTAGAAQATPEELLKPKVDFLPCLFKAAVLHFQGHSSSDLMDFRENLLARLESDYEVELPQLDHLSMDTVIPPNKESKKPFVRSVLQLFTLTKSAFVTFEQVVKLDPTLVYHRSTVQARF